MRLDELPTYVRTMQATAADLRGLWARLDGAITAPQSVTTPASSSGPGRASSSGPGSSGPASPPGPSYGFHAPAPPAAPRLPAGEQPDARAYAARLVKLCSDLRELERAFTACARVIRKVRERFAGEPCGRCSLVWVECRELELEGRRCCMRCTHGRAPRTLSTR